MTPHLEQAEAILADLIAFPTISADSNLAIIDYLAAHLEACGARVEIMHDPSGQKANLFATLGPASDGGIVLSGHSDVVPVADQAWTSDPFAMVERDGRLYGRGTCDMKGFLAACLAMAPDFARQVGDQPLHFAITYDEEVGCYGARHLAQVLRAHGLKPRLAIVGEPTEMRIIEGHKGCNEYTTRFHGLEGHGSAPDEGVNAVEYAARYAARLVELREALKARAPAGSRFAPPWTTINLGALHGGAVHNVIPPKAELAWEMRPVQDTDAAFVKAEMARFCTEVLLPDMRRVHPEAAIETEVIAEAAAFLPTEANAARALVTELTGANRAEVVPFGTEAGFFQELGMDVVVCGPGSIAQAHKADEYLAVDQLAACLEMLARLARRLA